MGAAMEVAPCFWTVVACYDGNSMAKFNHAGRLGGHLHNETYMDHTLIRQLSEVLYQRIMHIASEEYFMWIYNIKR